MAAYTVNDIARIVNGRQVGSTSVHIDHIVTDSRKILFPSGSIFFAIAGYRRDGQIFLAEAFLRGVRCFVVSRLPDINEFPEAVFILVDDTLMALQTLVAFHRSKFNFPVIGITGSNGKTIVKEWLNHLLQDRYSIVRNPKSYNSQIGVPLSVWQMKSDDELGIFEAGISTVGEMEKLARIIRPDIGIFTNIGEAHSEGFTSVREKIREKLSLFTGTGLLVYCRDYKELDEEVMQFQETNNIRCFRWSRNEGADVQFLSALVEDGNTHIRLRYHGDAFDYTIPFTGAAAVENSVTCAMVMLGMGMDIADIVEGMKTIPTLAMRLEMKQGINRCTVINDSYSADLSSLQLALDFLLQQQQHDQRVVILSDIPESGIPEGELYLHIATILKRNRINRLKGIGPLMSKYLTIFTTAGLEAEMFMSTTDFIAEFHPLQYKDELILIKGARVFEFEQINQLLEVKMHQTVLSINLTAISHNLNEYRKYLSPQTKLMVMVKAFSYGSGSYEIANLMQFHKVDFLAVAYTDEGTDLRKAGISTPIMVMNPEEASFAAITGFDLQPEIFSFQMLHQFRDFLKAEGINEYPIHIKLDTGMHRLGFEEKDLEALVAELKNSTQFRVVSVFTHLVASEDPKEDEFTRKQSTEFKNAADNLSDQLGYSFLRHISNTAAIHRHPDLQMDMVRLGIGLYGSGKKNVAPLQLQEASSLTTTIAQIRDVKAGESVGYNRKGVLNRDSRIATIRIGYADGYPRSLSNGIGKVLIRNQLVPVAGLVCMDMTMIDVTDIPGLEEGEEVIIFGKTLSVNKLAEWADTIPYDIMTGISQRVKRVYFEE